MSDGIPQFANCECLGWERVDILDLRGGDHHSLCKHYKRSFYARVKLEGAGSYIVPINDLQALQADLHSAADDGDETVTFTITLVDMTPFEYSRLKEFEGH